MVNFVGFEKVSLDSLKSQSVELKDKYLFIKFKEKKGLYQDFTIINKDWNINVFENILYAFEDDDLKGRICVDDIEFIISYGGVFDE